MAIDNDSFCYSIVLLKLPYKPITVEVEVVWHDRLARDPGFRWIREGSASAAAEFAASIEEKTQSLAGN